MSGLASRGHHLIGRFAAGALLLMPLTAPAQTPRAPPAIASQQVAPATADSSGLGFTRAYREVKLSMPVAGRIERVLVEEGSRVREGQLLLYLDRTLEELEVRRRKLQLEDHARLDELKQRELTLVKQVSSLKELLPGGVVPRKQVEDEELSLGNVIAERKTIEATKQRERVELSLAEEAYQRRHLRSPLNGVVTKVEFYAGESIEPHATVMWVVDVSRVRFMGTVRAQPGLNLKVGMPVRLELGLEGQMGVRVAKLVYVSPVIDPASGRIDVIAEFDNPDGSVRPGVSGRMVF
ncbi:MAG: efflux RND transporter periplasmic adaptor subunit [Burkholderiaceae bacterium]